MEERKSKEDLAKELENSLTEVAKETGLTKKELIKGGLEVLINRKPSLQVTKPSEIKD